MNVKKILLHALFFIPCQVFSGEGVAKVDSCANSLAGCALGSAATVGGLSAGGILSAPFSLIVASSIATGVGAGLHTSLHCRYRSPASNCATAGIIPFIFLVGTNPVLLPVGLCLGGCACAIHTHMTAQICAKRCCQDSAKENIAHMAPVIISTGIDTGNFRGTIRRHLSTDVGLPPQHFMASVPTQDASLRLSLSASTYSSVSAPHLRHDEE